MSRGEIITIVIAVAANFLVIFNFHNLSLLIARALALGA